MGKISVEQRANLDKESWYSALLSLVVDKRSFIGYLRIVPDEKVGPAPEGILCKLRGQ
jgi:hypothetical protein